MANADDDHLLWGWDRFLRELSSFLREAERQHGVANQAYSEYVLERLQTTILSLSALISHFNTASTTQAEVRVRYSSYLVELRLCVREIATHWERHLDQLLRNQVATSYTSSLAPPISGRPRFDITREQLEYLASMSFSWTQISQLLGVSRMTIYRRRLEYGLLNVNHVNVSVPELRTVLLQLRTELPALGETMVWGRLQSMGICVRRDVLRRTIREVDPLHTALRWRGELTGRRPYSVPGPNSLWHLDGHHKLIRWRLVTHCAIDGYSRLVVFIKCSNNNRATTVHESFLQGVQQYGLPSRVRCDQGGENTVVAQHMIHVSGSGRSSVIVGSSVHNQRIERLWRDMHRCVTGMFYRLFYFLEHWDLLDPINETHLYALHYVYNPRINQALQQFKESWNHHRIRTAGGMSPHQLFTSGALQLRNSGMAAVDFFDEVPDDYGMEENGLPVDSDNVSIEVPPVNIHLTDQQMSELQESVHPLSSSENFGIELYRQALEIIH